jgi:chromate reductase, NAD(P)H dehydrogenase (quinone)
MRILGVSGSLQRGSSNLALLECARELAPTGVEVAIYDGLRTLPQFNLDLEAQAPLPLVEAWRRELDASDALLLASPEYGFSLPGALKNAIDWVIGSGELERKVVGITASVNHAERGRRGLAALENTLSALSATVVGGVPIVRGAEFEDDVRVLLGALIGAAQAARSSGA